VCSCRPDDQYWSEILASGSPWKACFSASQDALKAAKNEELDSDDAPCGRFLPQDFGCQTFVPKDVDTGTFTNEISPLNGVVRFTFCGSYTLKGRVMTLDFEELRTELLWALPLPTLDIQEGQGARQWIEKLVRGGKKNTRKYKKRPNIYSWFYADDRVCVAQGSSGSVALWISDPSKKPDDGS
jgi:hypothetical protein